MAKENSVAAVILAAGEGTRMKSSLPKVLHALAGRSMIGHVLAAVDTLQPERRVVVIGAKMEAVAKAVAPVATAVQNPPRGTADAVAAARAELKGFTGDVLVLYGDTPLITPATLRAMLDARRGVGDPAVVVLGFRPADPGAYGRLIVGTDGALERIVEFKDANAAERAVGLDRKSVV